MNNQPTGNTMNAEQAHNMLKDDLAYIYSRENNDLYNMIIVLAAHKMLPTEATFTADVTILRATTMMNFQPTTGA